MVENITQYTKVEGGSWFPTNTFTKLPSDRTLDKNQLEQVNGVTIVQKIKLHSFKTSKHRYWDCINGWRKS